MSQTHKIYVGVYIYGVCVCVYVCMCIYVCILYLNICLTHTKYIYRCIMHVYMCRVCMVCVYVLETKIFCIVYCRNYHDGYVDIRVDIIDGHNVDKGEQKQQRGQR